VLLAEQDDLASHTSSASTKLIHGGLRYLEQLHFGLVRKALEEREVLLASAPHIMWPLRFVVPHDRHLRPLWLIRAGLFLYDHLAKRRLLPASQATDLRQHVAGEPLDSRFARGFIYSDVWVDDARLVVLSARDAAEHGATILTGARCSRLTRTDGTWCATLLDRSGAEQTVRARAVINATGPWVGQFIREATPVTAARQVRLVKGSHIIVPRLFEHRFAYLFQNADRRVVFALPYERQFTLIGTTDLDYAGDPASPRIEAAEVEYLCATPNRYFRQQITRADVRWSYSGVRPLLADESRDASGVTRDYALDIEDREAPLLSVFGGKITTYRKLAEDAVDRVARRLQRPRVHWTARAMLPGGDLPLGSFAVFVRALARQYPWLPPTLRHRYARAYGNRTERLLQGATSVAGLGEQVLPNLYEREIEYLHRFEWARSAEDILWRRSKLGLHLPPGSARQLDTWLARHLHSSSAGFGLAQARG